MIVPKKLNGEFSTSEMQGFFELHEGENLETAEIVNFFVKYASYKKISAHRIETAANTFFDEMEKVLSVTPCNKKVFVTIITGSYIVSLRYDKAQKIKKPSLSGKTEAPITSSASKEDPRRTPKRRRTFIEWLLPGFFG